MAKDSKKSKSNLGIIIVALLLCLGVSIGYAALSTTLNINGTSTIGKNSWSVVFTSAAQTANSDVTITPTIDATNTSISYTATLAKPGDTAQFKATIKNSGTLNAVLSGAPTLDGIAAHSAYATYTVTYADGSAIKAGDTLNANASVDVIVTVTYRSDITSAQLPTNNVNLNLTFSMNYVQA